MKNFKDNINVLKIINTIFLFILIGVMVIPILNSIAISFSTSMDSMKPGIALWPKKFSIEGYLIIFNRLNLMKPFLISLFTTVTGTLLHVVLCSLAAYTLVQNELKLKKVFTIIILISMMIPAQAILVPQYIVFKQFGLINNLGALIVSGLVSGFSILLLTNYFKTVPFALFEAALIDGASHFKILTKIYLPIAKPGLITVALFEFVARWNDFTTALLYLNDPKLYTLQLVLRSIISSDDSTSTANLLTNNAKMAGVVIALVPVLLIYPFVQKYFVSGMNLGAVKE